MTSRLAVSGDEIPIKVSMELNGRTETQTLILRIVKEPAPAAS